MRRERVQKCLKIDETFRFALYIQNHHPPTTASAFIYKNASLFLHFGISFDIEHLFLYNHIITGSFVYFYAGTKKSESDSEMLRF